MDSMSDRLKGTLDDISDTEPKVPALVSTTELVPYEPKQIATNVPMIDDETSDLRDDYIKSRNITHDLIDMSGSALHSALQYAVQTQHPKAFEMFNTLATTMRGLAKDLIDTQKVYKEIKSDKEKHDRAKAAANEAKNTVNIQNNIQTEMSLSDILKAVQEASEPFLLKEGEEIPLSSNQELEVYARNQKYDPKKDKNKK